MKQKKKNIERIYFERKKNPLHFSLTHLMKNTSNLVANTKEQQIFKGLFF